MEITPGDDHMQADSIRHEHADIVRGSLQNTFSQTDMYEAKLTANAMKEN